MTADGSADATSISAAAWFVVEQPGWIERVTREHTRRDDGSCAGCGSSQLVAWPCVLIAIADEASRSRNRA
jgi:hypothetical protein